MTGLTLGTLKRLPVRDVFKDEAGDFTPWLALPDNLAKIGNIIGLDLELVGTEYAVGPFAADILCKATPGDGYVIIENQTTVSDQQDLQQVRQSGPTPGPRPLGQMSSIDYELAAAMVTS